jgi:hypothetical protein
MRTPRTGLLTGTAALTLAGLAEMAAAQSSEPSHGTHVMMIRPPNAECTRTTLDAGSHHGQDRIPGPAGLIHTNGDRRK